MKDWGIYIALYCVLLYTQIWRGLSLTTSIQHPPAYWNLRVLPLGKAWLFQRNYVMREVMDMHCKANARRAFVIEKYIHLNVIFVFGKFLTISLDKTLIPQLGSCRALWSCIETAVWTFNPLTTIEAHYMEKNLFKLRTSLSCVASL